jgi:hypothetical protein
VGNLHITVVQGGYTLRVVAKFKFEHGFKFVERFGVEYKIRLSPADRAPGEERFQTI